MSTAVGYSMDASTPCAKCGVTGPTACVEVLHRDGKPDEIGCCLRCRGKIPSLQQAGATAAVAPEPGAGSQSSPACCGGPLDTSASPEEQRAYVARVTAEAKARLARYERPRTRSEVRKEFEELVQRQGPLPMTVLACSEVPQTRYERPRTGSRMALEATPTVVGQDADELIASLSRGASCAEMDKRAAVAEKRIGALMSPKRRRGIPLNELPPDRVAAIIAELRKA
jgi:hypothetical protein